MKTKSKVKVQKTNTKAKVKKVPKAKVKKRDSAASKDRLIAAGTQLFSTHGFNGVTTKMIAKDADVNESLIGRYFGGKEGLFIAIVQKFITDFDEEELPYPPQDNVEVELNMYAEHRVFAKDEFKQCLGKMIIAHALVDDKFRKRAMKEIPMHVDKQLEARITRLFNSNKLSKKHKVTDICEDLETYLHGVFLFDVILMEIPQNEILKKIRNFISRFVGGLIN